MGGKLTSVTFTVSGTFNVPANVRAVWVTAAGGGGGASGSQGNGDFNDASAGGPSGEVVVGQFVVVDPGDAMPVVVGAGGVGSLGHTLPGSGGVSMFGPLRVLGGIAEGQGSGGIGGGVGGSVGGSSGLIGAHGVAETRSFFGGSRGGGANGAGQQVGGTMGGIPPPVGSPGGTLGGGAGAGAALWGAPAGADANAHTQDAGPTQYGAGAGGDGSQSGGGPYLGGTGAAGYVQIVYIA